MIGLDELKKQLDIGDFLLLKICQSLKIKPNQGNFSDDDYQEIKNAINRNFTIDKETVNEYYGLKRELNKAKKIIAIAYQRNTDSSKRIEFICTYDRGIKFERLGKDLYQSMIINPRFLKKEFRLLKNQPIHLIVSIDGKVVIASEYDKIYPTYFTIEKIDEKVFSSYLETRSQPIKFDPLSIVLPKEFKLKNTFEDDLQDLIKFDQDFASRKLTRKQYQHKNFDTPFSDFEAIIIVGGLSNSRLKKLHYSYFKGNTDEEQLAEVHYAAYKAWEKYGFNILNFCLSLPKLPFGTKDPIAIFTILDKRKNLQENPVIRLSLKHADEHTEVLVSFYQKEANQHNVIGIKSRDGQLLMRVSRNGRALPEAINFSFKPVLELFLQFSDDPHGMIVNYGLETGKCSICGRKLEDKKSILNGIGPVCAASIS